MLAACGLNLSHMPRLLEGSQHKVNFWRSATPVFGHSIRHCKLFLNRRVLVSILV